MGNEIGKTQAMGEMELSAFAEMSNIVVGAYLSSLANMLSFSVMPSPPKTAYDMLQSVIDVILARLSRSADEILYIKTHISIGDEKIEGSMIVMFNEDSLKKVLNKLKELYGVSV
jgi:chemotaxis protein CheC